MKRRTFFKLLSWGAFFGGIGYVRADSKNISSHSEGELFPHEEGVDTTGSEDASAALSKLVLRAIKERRSIRCRSSDVFLLKDSIVFPYMSDRFTKATFRFVFDGGNARFYPANNNIKMFFISRTQLTLKNIRICNDDESIYSGGYSNVTALNFGALINEYMGYMYCTIKDIDISGVNIAIEMKPGSSEIVNGKYDSPGAYYCSFYRIHVSNSWYFAYFHNSNTPDNSVNRHWFHDCTHQGGLVSIFGEPHSGGDCVFNNFLAETINWTPRKTGAIRDVPSTCSVVWADYDAQKGYFAFANSKFNNCIFEGGAGSVPNYFLPTDGCVGIIVRNLISSYRGGMLGTGRDTNLYPTINNSLPDAVENISGSLRLQNPKSGISQGGYKDAKFNSRLSFFMYNGTTQFRISGFQDDNHKDKVDRWGIDIWDFVQKQAWEGDFSLPAKLSLGGMENSAKLSFNDSLILKPNDSDHKKFVFDHNGFHINNDEIGLSLSFHKNNRLSIEPSNAAVADIGSVKSPFDDLFLQGVVLKKQLEHKFENVPVALLDAWENVRVKLINQSNDAGFAIEDIEIALASAGLDVNEFPFFSKNEQDKINSTERTYFINNEFCIFIELCFLRKKIDDISILLNRENIK